MCIPQALSQIVDLSPWQLIERPISKHAKRIRVEYIKLRLPNWFKVIW